jgi:hypothetical protein
MKKNRLYAIVALAAIIVAGCGGTSEPARPAEPATPAEARPAESSLRDSFAEQLAANSAVKDFERQGDDLTFSGPGTEGDTSKWRIHIDSAVIEETGTPRAPYKGTVKSSWYDNGKLIQISADGIESNLPSPLISNGLAQDCFAYWNAATKKWSWE